MCAVRSRGMSWGEPVFRLTASSPLLKVWRGGGCKFSATERAHKRNGDRIDAECRLPGLVTTLRISKVLEIAPQPNDEYFGWLFLCRRKCCRKRLKEKCVFFLGAV